MNLVGDIMMTVSRYECQVCRNVNLIQAFLNCPEYCGKCGSHKSYTKEMKEMFDCKDSHGCTGHPCGVCKG